MWKTKENATLLNENLKNTIEKQTTYRTSPSISTRFVKITQQLSETTLSYELPYYLLNLFISYYKDAAVTLEKLNDFMNTTETNEANVKNLNGLTRNLHRKLNDYQSIFEYYLESIKSASQNPIKFRSSMFKGIENLKFIPVNLHLENFVVESADSMSNTDSEMVTLSKENYSFTSVGAFTTIHTNKPNYKKSVDQLMIQDNRGFKFSKQIDLMNDNVLKAKTIENEILLKFYSLKLFIQMGDSLKELSEILIISDKAQVFNNIYILNENIQIIHKCIIESYQRLFEQFANLVRIEQKQNFYNLQEKMNFFKVKFEAFTIEINNLVLHENYDRLSDIVKMIISVLIEFYNIIISDGILDKFDFINNCASFSQSFTTLISSIDFNYYKNPHMDSERLKNLLDFHLENGILFQVESMLSCFSTENAMVYDHYNAIQNLNYVLIHMPGDFAFNQHNSISIDFQKDGFHVYMYSSFESATKPIQVCPILCNVGINEQAISSNIFGNDYLQRFVNTQAIVKLKSYFENARNSLHAQEIRLDCLFHDLKTNRSYVEDFRPIELLQKIAEITRLMMGIRVTNCKSGKDRTGVSVSLEQCLILQRNHEVSTIMMQQILDDLRRNGTRIDVVRKNVGHCRYAFNKIRYYLLPKDYRPPFELCDDLET